ncbi:MAG: cytochrome C oxidase subunit I [Daejeonella sp.]|uniref:cytochrome C oxidase subunit I n=1 Tax=Daejeonella sp. TaxID=2805397 RepID=UPI00273332D7|nr:cytochrome C oxidase subunit I [Daejeonella sp.]MDP3468138.1 cytochrome C oxidase subunit I [Daejeonella sp.]
MPVSDPGSGLQQTTSYKVVLPFYVFAAVSFLISCTLLLLNTDIFHQHYFQPQTLAITHLMALGWGTMIILGASHQLLPVLIEGKLDSFLLALLSFIFAAVGIPLLVTGFYLFNTGLILQSGAVLINASVICYFLNVITSIGESKKYNIHAFFIATASLWLFTTTFFGLLLVFNFSRSWLPENSIEYLSIHAHMGIAGWFLLVIIGVASRLIPMFLISKYSSPVSLWWIFALINIALLGFIILKSSGAYPNFYYSPFLLVLIALILFGYYNYKAFKERIRKHVDKQMKISLLSVAMLLLPLLSLLVVIYSIRENSRSNMVLLYGFCIFFGWITALIMGMTFKTLPFIIWNKVYQIRAIGKTPAPKELFSEILFKVMGLLYLTGFILFFVGILLLNNLLLKTGAVTLLVSAIVYVINVLKTVFHQAKE